MQPPAPAALQCVQVVNTLQVCSRSSCTALNPHPDCEPQGHASGQLPWMASCADMLTGTCLDTKCSTHTGVAHMPQGKHNPCRPALPEGMLTDENTGQTSQSHARNPPCPLSSTAKALLPLMPPLCASRAYMSALNPQSPLPQSTMLHPAKDKNSGLLQAPRELHAAYCTLLCIPAQQRPQGTVLCGALSRTAHAIRMP